MQPIATLAPNPSAPQPVPGHHSQAGSFAAFVLALAGPSKAPTTKEESGDPPLAAEEEQTQTGDSVMPGASDDADLADPSSDGDTVAASSDDPSAAQMPRGEGLQPAVADDTIDAQTALVAASQAIAGATPQGANPVPTIHTAEQRVPPGEKLAIPDAVSAVQAAPKMQHISAMPRADQPLAPSATQPPPVAPLAAINPNGTPLQPRITVVSVPSSPAAAGAEPDPVAPSPLSGGVTAGGGLAAQTALFAARHGLLGAAYNGTNTGANPDAIVRVQGASPSVSEPAPPFTGPVATNARLASATAHATDALPGHETRAGSAAPFADTPGHRVPAHPAPATALPTANMTDRSAFAVVSGENLAKTRGVPTDAPPLTPLNAPARDTTAKNAAPTTHAFGSAQPVLQTLANPVAHPVVSTHAPPPEPERGAIPEPVVSISHPVEARPHTNVAPPHAHPATPIMGPETARAVAMQIASIVPSQGPGFDLILRPEELGRVRLALTVTETGATLLVQAERPETLDLMRRHITLLEQELRAQGHGALSLHFATSGGDHPSGHTDHQQPRTAGGASIGEGGEDRTALPSAIGPIARTGATDHLDIRL